MTVTINTSRSSPNFNSRPVGKPIDAIVLHTTEGEWDSDLDWLCNPQASKKFEPVSCHYVISPTGEIWRIVDESKRAWHAGSGLYLGISDWNNQSIGIEVSRRSGDPWPQVQLDALRLLCLDLIARYGIRQSMIAAHRWIAPKRRSDPTNWSDAGLMAWIEELYAGPDFAALWGPHYFYFDESSIAASWRDNAAALGQATSDETKDARNRVWRLFDRGAISFDPATGQTVVYVPRTKQ